MQLETLLEKNWFPIRKLDFSKLDMSHFCNLSDISTNKGLIIEQYVRQLFEESGLEMLYFPPSTGFRFETHKYGGINVRSDNQILHEYDFIIKHEDSPYLIEVKSGKWRGVESKIDRSLKYGKKYFGDVTPLRIMSPMHAEHKVQAETIAKKYPDGLVGFIDLKYSQKDLAGIMSYLSKNFCVDD